MLPKARRGRSRKELPAINSKLLAFIAGVAITLLGAVLVRPLLESDPPPAIPSIEVGAAGTPAKQQKKGKKTKAKRKRERRGGQSRGASQSGGASQPSGSGTPPSDRFTPARPAPKPEPVAEPAPAPPPVSDDDDDDDDGDDDDGVNDD